MMRAKRIWKCFINLKVELQCKFLKDFFIIIVTIITIYSSPGQPQTCLRCVKLELLSALHLRCPEVVSRLLTAQKPNFPGPHHHGGKMEMKLLLSTLPFSSSQTEFYLFVHFFSAFKIAFHVHWNLLRGTTKVGYTDEFVPNFIAS